MSITRTVGLFDLRLQPPPHHDLPREEELVDFSALLPRPDDAELAGRFAVVRGRLADDSLGVDLFAAGRGSLDGGALDVAFLAAGRDADDLAGDAPDMLLPSEARDDLRSDR